MKMRILDLPTDIFETVMEEFVDSLPVPHVLSLRLVNSMSLKYQEKTWAKFDRSV